MKNYPQNNFILEKILAPVEASSGKLDEMIFNALPKSERLFTLST